MFWFIISLIAVIAITFNWFVEGIKILLEPSGNGWRNFFITLGVCVYFLGMPTGAGLVLGVLVATFE